MRRVLWIEGDAARRAAIRTALEAAGLEVEESATGADALGRARAGAPDVVLVDAALPDGRGLELVAQLRRERGLAQVPCVALSDDPSRRAPALAAGCERFVEPPEPAEVVAAVQAVLEGAGARAGGGAVGRFRSSFIHDLAHEISTPLTPISGYLKILQSERLGPLAPQQRKAIDAMATAVAKLARIVDNLADFADLEAGEAAITTGPVDPDELAREVVEELRDSARDARLHVEVRPSGGGPVLADRRKLRQALCNVVQNAVKFSPHGGEVLVEVARHGERLRFSVYDQGPGVAGAAKERIFEPFHHAERGDEARAPGSGLGLPVARRIAEAHGGSVEVESPPHTQPAVRSHHYPGAKFVIEIPAVPVPGAGVPAPPARLSGA
jgi:signal transduction histidine kinase